MAAPSLTPMAASGSSSSRTLASENTERATAMAWRWPPDRLATSRSTDFRVLIPMESSCSLACFRIALLRSSGQRTSSRLRNMFWYTVSWLTSARSWYTMSMPAARACVTEVKCTSWPLSRIRPLVGGWKPQMILSRVDLPAPLSPISPSTSPRPRCRFTSTSAVTAP